MIYYGSSVVEGHNQNRQRKSNFQRLAGAAMVVLGTSRMHSVGRMVDVGMKSKNPLVGDVSRSVRRVHTYAGDAYDVGHKRLAETKYGSGAIDLVKPYDAAALTVVGAGTYRRGQQNNDRG